MKVELRKVNGLTLVGKGESGHWIVADGPKEFGGHESASRPMELFLLSLGGCTAMDVISLLDKMRVEYDDLNIKVEGETAKEHPKVFTSIKIEYIVTGDNVDTEKLKKAIGKSQEKYCPVSAMLRKTIPLSYDYRILSKENT